jgi:excisionase family DNA binding protein
MFLRLERIEDHMGRMENALANFAKEGTGKAFYTTAEVAEQIGKSEYTVREWARKKLIRAQKDANGRGWRISHEELVEIRNGKKPLRAQRRRPGG